jgi:hypothetical protein
MLDCGNGFCKNDTKCECKYGYISIKNETCNYGLKSKRSGFVMSLILGNRNLTFFSTGNYFYINHRCVGW